MANNRFFNGILYMLWILIGIGIGVIVFALVFTDAGQKIPKLTNIFQSTKARTGTEIANSNSSVAVNNERPKEVTPELLVGNITTAQFVQKGFPIGETEFNRSGDSDDGMIVQPQNRSNPFQWETEKGEAPLIPPPLSRVEKMASVDGLESIQAEGDFLARVFSRAPVFQEKVIALTFDDGWNSDLVSRTLVILKEKNVSVTLFPVGSAIRQHGALWQQAIRDGHELGNHTYSHRYLSRMSLIEIDQEISAWFDALDGALGYHYETKWFRPPGMAGFAMGPKESEKYRKILKKYDMNVALWNVDTMESIYHGKQIDVPPEIVATYVVSQAKGGSIILLHFVPSDIEALPLIIDGLRAEGYTFKTLSEITLGTFHAKETCLVCV